MHRGRHAEARRRDAMETNDMDATPKASGLVIDGADVLVPGLTVVSWRDDPSLRLKMGQDGRKRRPGEHVRRVVLHTTRGVPGGHDQRPQVIHPGVGPAGSAAEANARYWSRAPSCAGAHLVVDYDGSVVCTADLAAEVSYHAGATNGDSIGIEIVQGADAGLYEGQLAAVVVLCGFLADRFGLARTAQYPYRGAGDAVAAFLGHRDVSDSRGRGDPGDAVMERLIAAGWAPIDRGHK